MQKWTEWAKIYLNSTQSCITFGPHFPFYDAIKRYFLNLYGTKISPPLNSSYTTLVGRLSALFIQILKLSFTHFHSSKACIRRGDGHLHIDSIYLWKNWHILHLTNFIDMTAQINLLAALNLSRYPTSLCAKLEAFLIRIRTQLTTVLERTLAFKLPSF